MNKAVWLVSSGNYSDYGIDAVFSTQEAAEAYADHFNRVIHGGQPPYGEEMRVEEFPLDIPIDHETLAYVKIDKTGKVIWNGAIEPDDRWADRTTRVVDEGGDGVMFIGVGKSFEHARRSAEELRRVTLTTPEP